MTEDQFKKWDGETVIVDYDRDIDAWILIAIHSTRRGPSAGGVRIKNYVSFDEAVSDVLRLSEAMTYKFATVNMKWGGGKTVIYAPENLSFKERQKLLTRLGTLLRGLNGNYFAGPDIGTDSSDMNLLYTLAPGFVFSRTVEAGGAGSSSIPTAHGVFSAIQAAARFYFGSGELSGRHVLVQGVGNVGGFLLSLLRDAGALVSFSETNEALINEFKNIRGYSFVAPPSIYETPCDIFSPCALGGILNSDTIAKLECKCVVGAANNQLESEEHAQLLKERGILYAPDYIVNLGGAVGITSIEAEGFSWEESLARVRKSIANALQEIFERAQANDINTLQAAKERAMDKLTRPI